MSEFDNLQGTLHLLVLKILSRRPRLHGYAIMTKQSTDKFLDETVLLEPAAAEESLTSWGRVAGTVAYMSPEQVHGGISRVGTRGSRRTTARSPSGIWPRGSGSWAGCLGLGVTRDC
jgi:hypothetical protein